MPSPDTIVRVFLLFVGCACKPQGAPALGRLPPAEEVVVPARGAGSFVATEWGGTQLSGCEALLAW